MPVKKQNPYRKMLSVVEGIDYTALVFSLLAVFVYSLIAVFIISVFAVPLELPAIAWALGVIAMLLLPFVFWSAYASEATTATRGPREWLADTLENAADRWDDKYRTKD